MIYDIIGDIHGQADKLIGLLTHLGYQNTNGVFTPPVGHHAIFVGDFIDRGAKQLEVLQIVFTMIDKGYAHAVMGNHEYNAIAFATLHNGDYLRPHSNKNIHQHQVFLDAVGFDTPTHHYWLNRFFELPLWLEFDDFIIIHACFDQSAIDLLSPYLNNAKLTKDNFITLHTTPSTNTALHQLLSGVEVILPEPYFLIDGQGIKRTNMRIAWWQENLNQPLLQISAASNCNTDNIDPSFYAHIDFSLTTKKPIFIGHYWLKDTPNPLSNQVVCTDYSAGTTGYLTAYRFDTNNPVLSHRNFVQFIHPN